MRNLTRITLGALIFAAGLLAALLPSLGQAHTGNASISCTAVTFNYVDFEGGASNTVNETLTIDGVGNSSSFTFVGASGSHTIAIHLAGGQHTITAASTWDTNGHQGSFTVTAKIHCDEPTQTTPPPTHPTPTTPTPTTPTPTTPTETATTPETTPTSTTPVTPLPTPTTPAETTVTVTPVTVKPQPKPQLGTPAVSKPPKVKNPHLSGNPKTDKCRKTSNGLLRCKGTLVVPGSG